MPFPPSFLPRRSYSSRRRCCSDGATGLPSNKKPNQRRTTMTALNKGLSGIALAAGLLGGMPCVFAGSGELHIYNWTDYTSDEMIKKFEAETGINVTIDTYDSNETALAKLSSSAAGYDVMI